MIHVHVYSLYTYYIPLFNEEVVFAIKSNFISDAIGSKASGWV